MAHPTQWGMTLHEFPTGTKVYEPAPMGLSSTYVPAGKLTEPLQTYLSKEDEQKDFVCINQENIKVDNKLTQRIWIKPQDSIYYNGSKTNKTLKKYILILVIVAAIIGIIWYKRKHK